MRDSYNNVEVAKVLGPVELSADNTPANIDLQGFESALLQLDIGIGGITFSGTNKIEFVLTHSDDGSSFSNVTADDVLGLSSVTDGIVLTLDSAHAAAAQYIRGYVGGKRYLRVLADFSGTHGSGTPIAINVLKGHPHIAPPVA